MLPKTFRNKRSCCFTGHRARYLPGGGDPFDPDTEALCAALSCCVAEAIELGITRFYAGGADGFDTLAAETVLKSRRFAPHIELFLALPSRTQADAWSKPMQKRYQAILEGAAKVHYMSESDNSTFSMHARNRYLVDHADCCIAYLRRPSGGTLFTLNYALDCGLPCINLAEHLL